MGRPASSPAGTLIPPVRRRTPGERALQVLGWVSALAVLSAVGYLLRFLLLPLAVALVLTYVMGPAVDHLENRGLPRWVAVSICFTLLLGGLATLVVGTLPSLEAWLEEAPQPGQRSAFELQLEQRLGEWQAGLSRRYRQLDWAVPFSRLHHFLQAQRRTLVEELPAMALNALSQAGSVLLALVMAYFVLLDGARMKKAVVAWVPNRHFENALVMLHRVDRQISSYLIGTAAESALVTVLLAVPLYLLKMPNAFLFAVIFGAANVIPFAGPFIGAAAGVFYSLLDPSAPSIGALVLVYTLVHGVDAMFINPWVLGKTLDMHPLTVIVGISVGGALGGVVGMLAIIPAIAVTKAIASTVVEGMRNGAA